MLFRSNRDRVCKLTEQSGSNNEQPSAPPAGNYAADRQYRIP